MNQQGESQVSIDKQEATREQHIRVIKPSSSTWNRLTEHDPDVHSNIILGSIDDENCRRKILARLNREEGRHAVACVTFHGQ
jgi:TnpA family transposase